MKNRLILSLLALAALTFTVQAQLLRTTVAQGEIEGVEHEGHALYKNIPYAEAPVGNLRWKAPVAKRPWKGVYRADRWAPLPPQPLHNPKDTIGVGMSEDCLYLSVETPAKSTAERLPVFVMIHGGGFMTGSYKGTQESFMREGIVYCSVEYRLGALGFMCHPELSKESSRGLSGNYGILDQVMALQWIHDNIEAFGGDPEKITIAGESAGGISVSIQCASPLAKGLFRAAISESGSSFWPVGDERNNRTAIVRAKAAERDGLDLQKLLGKKNLKQMRKVAWQELVPKVKDETFWPVVDGHAIIDDQYKLYSDGRYNDVDVLMGTNSDEGSMFCRPEPVSEYERRVHDTYGEFADCLLALYPAKNEQEVYFAESDVFRDDVFAWGTYAWANLQRKTGKGKVYMYYFDQCSENTIVPSLRGGASHVAEMPFFYGYKFGNGKMTASDKKMKQIISRYIINFVKNGNPNGHALPYWPIYKKGKPTVMIMREGLHLDVLPNQKQMDFFEKFFRSRRK